LKTYPSDIEKILGIDQVRLLLKKQCGGQRGAGLVEAMRISGNKNQIALWLKQVHEYVQVLESVGGPAISDLDLNLSMSKLDVKDLVLDARELNEIRSVCQEAMEVVDFFDRQVTAFPELHKLVSSMTPPQSVIDQINGVFDPEGMWKRNASKKLNDALDGMEAFEKKAYSALNKIYNQAKKSEWTAETGITVKEGRLVIPVFAENKRKIQGIVHDESGGGKILYIEPVEVLEYTNRIKEFELERDREIRRLLLKLTGLIRPYRTDLKDLDHKMGVLDFIRSKARFAKNIGGVMPILASNATVEYKNLSHPLLIVQHRDKKLAVVPMDVSLDSDDRLMVVSGPNTGGKSVSIKTLAINQYLLQCGLLIPCKSESKVGIFDQLLIDIGDNQSIENDLSSYSSHLTAMKHFIEKSTSKTMIVIDEIGSGTDPNFGGAMAEAVLFTLNQKEVKGMVTTHFGNIKTMANQTEGMFNGSMEYDIDRLQPLYKLLTGQPGSSFALEVAKNIGLDRKLIEMARKRSNTVQQKTDTLLARLESERGQTSALKVVLQEEKDHYAKLRKDYQKLKEDLKLLEKGILDKARKEAIHIIDSANSAVERTIRDLREKGGEKLETKEIRNVLKRKRDSYSKELDRQTKPARAVQSTTVKPVPQIKLDVGIRVHIPNSEAIGEIIELRKDKAVVVAGIIKQTIPLKDLKPAGGQVVKEKARPNLNLVRAQADFVMEKDVRGMRGDEAIKEIDSWIDKAIVVGSPQLRLIHGKGDGILKKLIRDYYRNNPYIKKISYESVEMGGEGVSVFELKG